MHIPASWPPVLSQRLHNRPVSPVFLTSYIWLQCRCCGHGAVFLSHWSIRSTMFRLRSGVYRYNSCLSPDALSYDLTDPGPFPLLVPTGLCTRQGKKPCRPGSGTCKIYIKHQRMRYYHYTLMLLNCVSPFKFSF